MRKLLPLIFIGLPIVGAAQAKQQLVGQSKYHHGPLGFERTDSSSYYYMQNSPAGKPAYLPEMRQWNCDTMFTYTKTNALETRTTNIYNTDGSLAECHTESFQGSLPIGIVTMKYNGSGKMTEKARWAKASGSSQLVPYEKETYKYDANNQLMEHTWYDGERFTLPASYTPRTRNIYTYSVGTLTEILQEYYNTSGTWDAAMRTTYTYPTTTTMEELVEQNQVGGWGLFTKTTNTLDANRNILSSLRQEYDGTSWENDDEHTYTYDGNNNLLTLEDIEWTSSARYPIAKTEYTYNSDNNMLTSLKKMWDGMAYVIKDGSAATYNYYGFPTSVGSVHNAGQDVAVYPNPATNTIGIGMPGKGNYHAYLHDAMGRLVKTTSGVAMGSQLVNIDVQGLPAGNYVLRVHAGGDVFSQKVVIAR